MKGLLIAIAAMAGIIGLSNVAVQYPINDWLTWGALTYPLAFLVTDLTNRVAGAGKARIVVYAGFATGVALSLWLADPRIAIASGSAFLIAQLLDVAVFDRLRRMDWWKAPLASTLVGSVIDTALFFSIAFYGTGLPWVTWAFGDFAAKLAMALLLIGPFGLMRRWLPDMTVEKAIRA
jgi:uncharacterized PurR-regulated membrane protein YhhQ (DUF165 family)